MKVFILLSLAAVALAMPINDIPTNATVRTFDPWNIIGGHEVSPAYKYSFLVALVQKGASPADGQFCGATLIGADRVLTAAHCCDAIAASKMEVLLHWHDLAKSTQGERVAVTKSIMHPKYDASTTNNDVCVLHIAKKVEYAPAELDDGANSKSGTVATVAGWGNTSPSGSKFPTKAQEVQVPVITNEVCNGPKSYDGAITAGMMCAGYGKGGKDACQGDSGGPLFDGNTLIGVVSWGYGCAQPDMYGVYARVSHFKSWIEQQ